MKIAIVVKEHVNGDCNTLNFGLLSSNAEGGANNIYLRIEQGTSTLAEQQIPTSMEGMPTLCNKLIHRTSIRYYS